MNIEPLVQWTFALLLGATKPGGSVYSLEPMPECGTDPAAATCELKPVCGDPSALCVAPRWSKARNAWVRAETREHFAQRMLPVAEHSVAVARMLTKCLDAQGAPVEECTPISWPGGTRGLLAGITTIIVWESGGREDIEYGHPPAGRGPDGEVCLMQIMPRFASFAGSDAKPEDLLGEQNLDKCITAGAKILARKRINAKHACPTYGWDYSTFAFYGTGDRCSSFGLEVGDFALLRQKTYRKFLATKPSAAPDWALAATGQLEPEPVAIAP